MSETNIRIIPLTTELNLQLSVYIDDMNRGELRLNHPLQRYALQWEKDKKGNFIRRILQGGTFLPLIICTQFDKNGCEVSWLIDGKQRLTTLKEFINGDFAIHPKTRDYLVTYDGILYEKKSNKNRRFGLKKNRNGEYIPILDEHGNIQKIRQTIDIRGLKFDDLPPELKDKFKRYIVPAQVKHNCTDEDIKLEILDYNSGSPMNVAQIGKSTLGDKLASLIRKMSEHSFILDKCGFSTNNKIKGVTERSIGEALGLVSFGVDGWVKGFKELCLKMSECIGESDIEWFESLLDKLDDVTVSSEELKKHMVNKEFFIVLANFDYFMGKGYKAECYGEFLQYFVSDLKYQKVINTDELDDDGNEIFDSYVSIYENSTKNKNVIESRLEQMNEMLDKYLSENCANMIEDGEDFEEVPEEEFVLDEAAPIELQEFAQNFVDDTKAIQCLMLTTDSPYSNFSKDKLEKMVEWYKNKGTKEMLNDCLFYKEIATDNIDENDANLPLYVYAIKYIEDNRIQINTDEWLSKFKENAFKEIEADLSNEPNLSSTIALKTSEIIKNIQDYEREVNE